MHLDGAMPWLCFAICLEYTDASLTAVYCGHTVALLGTPQLLLAGHTPARGSEHCFPRKVMSEFPFKHGQVQQSM